MRITRETLIRIAKETAQKRALSDPELVAAYLTGSLRTDNPFLGKATDVDIVFVHAGETKVRREVLPLTPEIHLDIVHNPRSDYDKPKKLRVHPWLGPELYDPLPLYGTQHFFEFVQAGVRDKYNEPASILTRSRSLAENARQTWSGLQLSQASGPELLQTYLTSIHLAVNAVALLTGGPLAERRFLLQFPARAAAAGQPDLAAKLLGLLGADQVEAATLTGFLPEWERTFIEAANSPTVERNIAVPRLGYYKLAFESMLASEMPQSVVWPLILTWTQSASVLPPARAEHWLSACKMLGLEGDALEEKLTGLDHFLDTLEEKLENMAAGQSL